MPISNSALSLFVVLYLGTFLECQLRRFKPELFNDRINAIVDAVSISLGLAFFFCL